MSTHPLRALSARVVGVDVSLDMLAHATRHKGVTLIAAAIEHLPFRDQSFSLATLASAIHWLQPAAFGEIERVLSDDALLAVYDVWFPGTMQGVPAFSEWLSGEVAPRYPSVPKHEKNFKRLEEAGFESAFEEATRQPIGMSIGHLTSYLMTHSERIAAIRDGREGPDEQRDFILDGLRPFYSGVEAREVVFGLDLAVFSRVRPSLSPRREP